MSDLLGRLEILRRLLQRGVQVLPWCGNLAIQKLVYLLQSVFGVPLGYTYGLHHLGPYSTQLAGDLSLGEQAGLWRSWEESYIGARGPGSGKRFEILEPTRLPPSVIEDADRFWAAIEPRVEAALEQIGGWEGRRLELVATIHYLRHVQQVREEQLVDVLRILKPKFSEAEIQWGKRQLAELEAVAASL